MTSYMTDDKCLKVINNTARFGYDYLRQWGLHHTVTGFSGGADSLLIACLNMVMAEMAVADNYPLNNFGMTLPVNSSADSLRLGRLTAEVTGTTLVHDELTDIFHFMTGALDWHEYFAVDPDTYDGQVLSRIVAGRRGHMQQLDTKIRQILKTTPGCETALAAWEWTGKLAQGNLRARLRMIVLYHFAQRVGGLVMSTDNLSEHLLAFWTKHGDVGDLGLIQYLFKGSEVYDLLNWFNKYRFDGAINPIIEAKPDDGLGINKGGDVAQIGAEYPDSDIITRSLINDGFEPDGELDQLDHLPSVDGYPDDTVMKIARRTVNGKHKRADCVAPTRAQIGLPDYKDVPVR
ncbi:MAG: NAD(+) synthase [Candidatus Uhrbacteria bacterium]